MAKADRQAYGSTIGETMQILLAAPLDGELEGEMTQLLCGLGLAPDQQNAILLQLIHKAKEGDFRSIQMVRELAEAGDGRGGMGFSEDLRHLSTEDLERMLDTADS